MEELLEGPLPVDGERTERLHQRMTREVKVDHQRRVLRQRLREKNLKRARLRQVRTTMECTTSRDQPREETLGQARVGVQGLTQVSRREHLTRHHVGQALLRQVGAAQGHVETPDRETTHELEERGGRKGRVAAQRLQDRRLLALGQVRQDLRRSRRVTSDDTREEMSQVPGVSDGVWNAARATSERASGRRSPGQARRWTHLQGEEEAPHDSPPGTGDQGAGAKGATGRVQGGRPLAPW